MDQSPDINIWFIVSSPSEVKQRHRHLSQKLWSFPLFVGVRRTAGVLVQHTEHTETQDRLQREHRHRHGKTDPGGDKEQSEERGERRESRRTAGGAAKGEGGGADSQLVPLDVIEEAPVRSGSLGLNRFEQVLPVVGQRTHHVVLLITATQQHTHC